MSQLRENFVIVFLEICVHNDALVENYKIINGVDWNGRQELFFIWRKLEEIRIA